MADGGEVLVSFDRLSVKIARVCAIQQTEFSDECTGDAAATANDRRHDNP